MPLVYLADNDRLILVASKGGSPRHPAWYHNVRAHPEVQVSVRGKSDIYRAYVASGEERAELWPRVVNLYRGYEVYQGRTEGRQIPIVVLTPQQTQ